MKELLVFIVEIFDFNVLILFLISSIFLAFDAKEFKKRGLLKEYRFSRFFGYFYIIIGMILYAMSKYIRL